MDNRPPSIVRGKSPCAGCTERSLACHDKCTKYQSWKAEVFEIQKKRNAYNKLNRRVLWDMKNS